ncbi:MAG: hypothetical protein Q9213_007567 [Squamulea squamosa]
MVIENSDYETLFSWSVTSKFCYDIAGNIIWECFCFRRSNLVKDGDRINAICSEPPFETKPLAQRAKKFTFVPRQDKLGSDALTMAWCMTDILKRVPNLHRVTLDGHIPSNALDILGGAKDLQKIKLRLNWEFNRTLPRENQSNLMLDFIILASLERLQTLRLGRLTPGEARGLASGIYGLPLTELRVSAAPPGDNDDVRKSYAGIATDKSPIELFLEQISKMR